MPKVSSGEKNLIEILVSLGLAPDSVNKFNKELETEADAIRKKFEKATKPVYGYMGNYYNRTDSGRRKNLSNEEGLAQIDLNKAAKAVATLEAINLRTKTLKNTATEMNAAWKTQTISASTYNTKLVELAKTHGLSIDQMKQFGMAMKSAHGGIGGIINRAMQTVPVWMAIRAVMQLTLQSFNQIFIAASEWQTQMAQIKIVATGTAQEYAYLSSELLKLGTAYGMSLKELGEGARLWAQQGQNLRDIIPLMQTTIKLSMISGKTMEESVSVITAIQKTYNITAANSLSIVDKLVKVDMEHAVTVGVLADAMERAAPQAAQLGISFDKLLGIITATHVATRATGEQIGNAWKTIFARMSTSAVSAIQNLAKVPVYLDKATPTTTQTKQFRDWGQILDEVALAYQTMDEVQQVAFARQLGQLRQINLITSAFQHWEEGIKATVESIGASGTAMRAMDLLLGTTEAKTKQLTAAWNEFGVSLIENGDWIKFTIDKLKDFAGAINTTFLLLFKGAAGHAKVFGGTEIDNLKDSTALLNAQITQKEAYNSLLQEQIKLEEWITRVQTSSASNKDEQLKILTARRGFLQDQVRSAGSQRLVGTSDKGNITIGTSELDTIYTKARVAYQNDMQALQEKRLILEVQYRQDYSKYTMADLIKTKEEIKQLRKLDPGDSQYYQNKIKNGEDVAKLEKTKQVQGEADQKVFDRELKFIEAKKSLGYSELEIEKMKQQYYKDSEALSINNLNDLKEENTLQISILEKIKARKDLLDEESLYTSSLKGRGFDDLTIERMKLELIRQRHAGEKEASEEEKEQIKVIAKMRQDSINEYSLALKDSMSGSFEKLMAGEGSVGDIFKNLGTTVMTNYRKTLADSLSGLIMTTGMGEMFGGLLTGMKEGVGGIQGKIELAHSTVFGQIVRGHRVGLSQGNLTGTGIPFAATASMGGGMGGEAGWDGSALWGGGGGYGGGTGGTGGMGGLGSIKSAGIFGKMGRFSQSTGGKIAGGSALVGYSMYQGARSGGQSQGRSIGAGIVGGLGAAALGAGLTGGFSAAMVSGGVMTAGTAGATATGGTALGAMGGLGGVLAAIPVWGWIALGIMLTVGALMMSSGKKQSQTTSQTQINENRISSKIEVTNKNLEIINRNLIALRTDIRTYILPASAYFAEKRNVLEENFALMSRRGFQG